VSPLRILGATVPGAVSHRGDPFQSAGLPMQVLGEAQSDTVTERPRPMLRQRRSVLTRQSWDI